MEQYVSQVERITLLEERDRLSKDLHDTMGHSYTSIIMGMETLRMELKSKEGEQQLDSLLQLVRNSMESKTVFTPIRFITRVASLSYHTTTIDRGI